MEHCKQVLGFRRRGEPVSDLRGGYVGLGLHPPSTQGVKSGAGSAGVSRPGGAIGAGVGVGLGLLTGGGLVTGALIGGGLGAIGGALYGDSKEK